jgi:hypothetical protein
MALCLTAGVAVTRLAIAAFTLAWTHSVEKVEWQEDWRIERDRLVLVESRVKGSGAGMEPGPGAVLENGWYRWRPGLAVPELVLARSDAVAGWRLCAGESCETLGPAGADAGPLALAPCP